MMGGYSRVPVWHHCEENQVPLRPENNVGFLTELLHISIKPTNYVMGFDECYAYS